MDHSLSYFEQAADVLREALGATNIGEQGLLLEKALRLHRLAVAEERDKLAAWVSSPAVSNPIGEYRAP